MPPGDYFRTASIAALGWDQPPFWPLPLRPSLTALAEPELVREVAQGGLAILGAAVLLLIALLVRKLRWPGLVASLTTALVLAAPHLDLLLVPATPTGYFPSPTGFSVAAIARGEDLYARHCQSCHGPDGHGDGPEAGGQVVPPADLTAEHLWDHPDGDLFWWIGHGMPRLDGKPAMPGFADRLSPLERWQVVDFLHANAAGAVLSASGAATLNLSAPDLTANCGDGRTVTLSQWRGRAVHLVAGRGIAAAPDLPVIILSPDEVPPTGNACIAVDPDAWKAYAVLAGLRAENLAGSQFLIAPDGWVLAHWPANRAPPASSLSALAGSLSALCLSPGAPTPGTRHHHRG